MERWSWMLVVLAGCRCTPGTADAPVDAPVTAPLPGSERVFAVVAAGRELVLGAEGNDLWAADATSHEILWRTTGSGAVHLVAAGDFGREPRLYAARGFGVRRDRDAPVVLQELDPATGVATVLWTFSGERNEPAHLSIADVDRDGRPDLAFAYFASKYEVRTHHIAHDGRVLEGPAIRMGTVRAWADVDGDGVADEIVGRPYGDAPTSVGDLRVDLGHGWVTVPTDAGVRAVAVASDSVGPALYFADGWVADYGKHGKAEIERARWDGTAFRVETVARLPEEYAVFELFAIAPAGLVARGSRRITWVDAAGGGAPRTVADIGEVLDAAVGPAGGGAATYIPGPTTTRVEPVTVRARGSPGP